MVTLGGGSARLSIHLVAAALAAALSPAASRAQQLEEVLVTATRRAESVQDIPISVTAFSAEAIEQLGFTQSYDVAAQVPNLQFMGETAQSIPFIFLRGIGNTSFYPNSINPVAVYIDSVYLGQNITQGFQLFDLERVEVLRGPQGTLFGRNSTAGLLQFVTRKPSVEDGLNGELSLIGGDFGQLDIEASGGAALGDSVAVRAAVFQQSGSGIYKHLNPALAGTRYGDPDVLGLRGQLRWEASDDSEVLLRIHYSDDQSELTPVKPGYIVSPFGVPNCPPGAVSGALGNGCSDPFGMGLTVAPAYDEVQLNFGSYQDLEAYGAALEGNWRFGDYRLTSITSWNEADMTRFEDDDGNLAIILSDTYLADAQFVSQELHLASENDGPTGWILGLYYYSDELNSVLNFNNRDLGPPPGSGIPVPLGLSQRLDQQTESWAAFGELTHTFREKWTLRAGLRVTGDRREVDIRSSFLNALLIPALEPTSAAQADAAALFPLIPPTRLEEDWVEWSGRIALDYAVSEDQMLYATVSRGFKGGEFNGGALLDIREATIADPEFLNNYEIGYKGDLLDRSLQLNLAAFYMEYEDQQVLITGATPFGLLPSLENAASSTIQGAEFEIKWQPNDSWFLLLGGAYLDAEFDDFFDPALGLDRSGNKLAHAPEWSVNGIVRFSQPAGGGVFAAQLDGNWNDAQFFTVQNQPGLQEDGYGIANARLSYKFRKEQVELALFAKNLFDEKYVVTGYDTASSGFGANGFVMGRPRTYGAQVILRYR